MTPKVPLASLLLLLLSCRGANCSCDGTAGPTSTAPPGPLVEVPGLEALEHKPLIVVRTSSPLSAPTLPNVVIYEDGLVLMARPGGEQNGLGFQPPLRGTLEHAHVQALVAEVLASGFLAMPQKLPSVTIGDDPYSAIVLRTGQGWKLVFIEGSLPDHRFPDPQVTAFARLYDRLTSLDLVQDYWTPRYIEVVLSASKDQGPPLDWPSDVPPLSYGCAMMSGESRQVVDGTYEMSLVPLQAHHGNAGVMVNGAKCYLYIVDHIPAEEYIQRIFHSPTKPPSPSASSQP